jgi:hypothetical protein
MPEGHQLLADLTVAIGVLGLLVIFEKRVTAAIRAGTALLIALGLIKKNSQKSKF